jgi:putative heme-binding domain-containing protein
MGAAAAPFAAADDNPLVRRIAAVSLLGRIKSEADRELDTLRPMIAPRSPVELQRAAVAAVVRIGGERVPNVLLDGWTTHSPELRGTILELLFTNVAWTNQLLDAMEKKNVGVADIDPSRRERLIAHGDKGIKERAAKLLVETNVAANRQKVLDAWQPVLSMKGDAKGGAERFRQHCAVCHKLNDQGQDVGANLANVREWTGEAMLTSILDPNRQVEPKYLAYTATTAGGEAIFGVVAAESGNSITMKGLDGKDRPVLRSELKSLVSTNRSLMPDGFESAMTKQQLADLLEFLRAPERAK